MSLANMIMSLINSGNQSRADDKQWKRWKEFQEGAPQREVAMKRATMDVDLEKQRMLDLNEIDQQVVKDDYSREHQRKLREGMIPVSVQERQALDTLDLEKAAGMNWANMGIRPEDARGLSAQKGKVVTGEQGNQDIMNLIRGNTLINPANKQLLEAASLAQATQPIATFGQGMTRDLSPGQYSRLNPTGNAELDAVLNPFEGMGAMTSKMLQPNIINGQQFGTKEITRTTPPEMRSLTPKPNASGRISIDPMLEQKALGTSINGNIGEIPRGQSSSVMGLLNGLVSPSEPPPPSLQSSNVPAKMQGGQLNKTLSVETMPAVMSLDPQAQAAIKQWYINNPGATMQQLQAEINKYKLFR